jgi:hypothetical protein
MENNPHALVYIIMLSIRGIRKVELGESGLDLDL